LRAGDDLWLFELANGDILLRRACTPKKSLVCHLRRLQKLKLNRQTELVREVVW